VQTEPVLLNKIIATNSCSDLQVDEPQEWASLAGAFSYKVTEYSPTAYDPACSRFTQSETTFEHCKADTSKNIAGLFTTPQRQETEIPYEKLRTEALACGMSPLADFRASFTVTGNSEIVSSSSAPIGVISSPSVKKTVVALGTYPAGEFPEICKTKTCTRTEIPTTTTGGTIADVNEVAAMSVATSTLKTYFPNADISTNCDDRADCFEININSKVEPLSVFIKGRTSAITSNIGIGSFPIKYEQSQYSERYIGD
jgi:hypothetical protein